MSDEWKEEARCKGLGDDERIRMFFEWYEEDARIAIAVDSLCNGCPVQRECLMVGVQDKEEGVWGGVYLKNGEVHRTNNLHKTNQDWYELMKRMRVRGI